MAALLEFKGNRFVATGTSKRMLLLTLSLMAPSHKIIDTFGGHSHFFSNLFAGHIADIAHSGFEEYRFESASCGQIKSSAADVVLSRFSYDSGSK